MVPPAPYYVHGKTLQMSCLFYACGCCRVKKSKEHIKLYIRITARWLDWNIKRSSLCYWQVFPSIICFDLSQAISGTAKDGREAERREESPLLTYVILQQQVRRQSERGKQQLSIQVQVSRSMNIMQSLLRYFCHLTSSWYASASRYYYRNLSLLLKVLYRG